MSARTLSIAETAITDFGAHQKPDELSALLDLVHPASTVVEVGCDQGGTLWALKQTGAYVIGVTLTDGWFGSGMPLDSHECPVIIGDSHSPVTLVRLVEKLAGRPVDLVFIDADHRYEAVLADFNTYAPLVRSGGIVALHDICPHPSIVVGGLRIDVGVERLWAEITGHFRQTREIVVPPLDWGGIGLITL